MTSVRTFEGKVLEGWDRRTSSNGIPYYANHIAKCTQWEHPLLTAVMEEIRDHDNIKYSAYRMAVKLRTVQRVLKIHQVSLSSVVAVFDQLSFQVGIHNSLIESQDLEDIVHDVFTVAFSDRPTISVELAAELTWNFLSNLLDPERTGSVTTFSVLVILVVLCDGRLLEKYKYLYRHIADHNNCITKAKLSLLLNEIAQIPEYFSENESFGKILVNAAVNSCFVYHTGNLGITEDVFFEWLLKEPQTLVWFSTFFRLATAELVSHNVKCSVCKMSAVVGLRYQCLQCFNYNLCQHCFFTGQVNSGHKVKHPMQEYYATATSKQEMKAFMKRVGNKLRLNKNRPSYLPITPSHRSKIEEIPEEEELYLNGPRMVSKILQTDDFPEECCSRTIVNGTPLTLGLVSQRQELESVIEHLEKENKNIVNQLARLNTEADNTLERDHRHANQQQVLDEFSQQLEMQIERLKKIMKSYSSGRTCHRLNVIAAKQFESTPFAPNTRPQFSHISPIESNWKVSASPAFPIPGNSISRASVTDYFHPSVETSRFTETDSSYTTSRASVVEQTDDDGTRISSFGKSLTLPKRLHSTSIGNVNNNASSNSSLSKCDQSVNGYLESALCSTINKTGQNSSLANGHRSSLNGEITLPDEHRVTSVYSTPSGSYNQYTCKYPSNNTSRYFRNSVFKTHSESKLAENEASVQPRPETRNERPESRCSSAYSSMEGSSNTSSPTSNSVSKTSDSVLNSPSNSGSDANTPSRYSATNDESTKLLSSLQLELDEILQHLEDTFPTDSRKTKRFTSGDESDLLQAALDVGNVLVDLVNSSARDLSVNKSASSA